MQKPNRMKQKYRFFILLVVAAASLLSLFSCDEEEKKRALTRAEKERLHKEDSLALKVAVLSSADCDFLRVADSLRLYDTLGVDVHLRRYNSLSECRYALNHKMVEAAVIDSVLAEEMKKTDDIDLTLSVPTALRWKFLTAKKSRVSRFGQLAEKVIATDSHGASRRLALNAVDSIVKKKKEIYIIQCEDVSVRAKMLITGNIDAALLPEPFATQALRKGAVELPLKDGKTYGVVAFRSEVLKDKRIAKQRELFEKACKMAKDSIAARTK